MNSQAAFGVEDLTVRIGSAHIVNGVTWSVQRGQTLGVVGESGSGKSMTVLAATGLVPRTTADIGGHAWLGAAGASGDGGERTDLLTLTPQQLGKVLGSRVGFVFQDPSTSLNPLLTVERQLTEGLEIHRGLRGAALRRRAVELLELVGIPDPQRRLRAYPHELSGGMRQRVMIAIALSCDPDVLIADEPTTALDVTVQAQILDEVRGLQERLGTAVVWITHDLGVVAGLADDVVVLYGGQVVESAPVDDLFDHQAHPYTRGLMAARPRLGRAGTELVTIPGSPPDPKHLPEGCVFWDRCELRADPRCETTRPELLEIGPRRAVRSFCAEETP